MDNKFKFKSIVPQQRQTPDLFKKGSIIFVENGKLSLPSVLASPSVTPSSSPSVSLTPTPSITPSISLSVTPSVTPSITVSVTPSATPSISLSVTPSVTPSATPSITISITPSVTSSVTPSITPSVTISSTPSISVSVTPSISKTPSVTPSRTPSVSVTPSVTPSSSGSDQLRAQLTTSVASYDAATVGNWVKITSTEYGKVATNVTGATKKGNNDTQINTRDVLTSYSNNWLAFGTTGNPSFQINTGEYVIAMITEAWNQSGGTSQLSYMTTFTGSVVANIGGTAGPSTGGGRDYYIRKAPTDSATETRYPTLYMTVSPNAVNNWSGFRSTNSGSSWTSLPNNQLPKIQIITTNTKSW